METTPITWLEKPLLEGDELAKYQVFAKAFTDGRTDCLGTYGLTSDARFICQYAIDYYGGCWPMAENEILRHGAVSTYYAINGLKGRFRQFEDFALSQPAWSIWDAYLRAYLIALKRRYPDAWDGYHLERGAWVPSL